MYGSGVLVLAVIAVVVGVTMGLSGNSGGTKLAASHGSVSPASDGNGNLSGRKPSSSPKARAKATQAPEPPALQPPQGIGDRVDWSPFAQAYGAATDPATGNTSNADGVTQVQASQSFGDFDTTGTVTAAVNAQYFGSASQARDHYDSVCGGSGAMSGSLRTADLGDTACSYVSDVSNGSNGSAILYVQVLRNNVVLQVAPMAYQNGAWTAAGLGTLRAASVKCAGNTVAKL